MKIPFSILSVLIALFCSGILSGFGRAYDAPDLDVEVFQSDGVFLEESEKQSLLEALASIASNFPGNGRVDSDLKEKALGIALQIDPLHFNSRAAHKALVGGRVPGTTGYLSSISAVSELLWTTSRRLLESPVEPDERQLAGYLMELSLLTNPAPPDDRIEAFARYTRGEELSWEKFVVLQRDDNPSTVRAQMVMREVERILSKPAKIEPSVKKVASVSKAAPKGKTRPPGMGRVELTPRSASLSCITKITAVDSIHAPGVFSLEIRRPDGPREADLFPFLRAADPSAYPRLPLLSSQRSISIDEIEISGSRASSLGWEWPQGGVGELSFETEEEDLPGPRRICKVGGKLAAMVLLESLLKEKPLSEDVSFAGELDEETGFAQFDGDVIGVIDTFKTLGKKYLLLPASTLQDLVESLQKTGDLSVLFEVEMISYTKPEEVVALCTGELPPALLGAVEGFAEVESVSDKMPLAEFARNEKVQERLESILEEYPDYLSARVMLEFGKTPISEENQIALSVAEIDRWIVKYFAMKDDDFDFNELKNQLEEVELGLSRIRTTIHPKTREYHAKAEDLFEAAERYLSLSNLTTSTADQRLREVEGAIAEAEDQRKLLSGPTLE